jgi:hypothetical protein
MALALSVVGAPDDGRDGGPITIRYTVRFVEVEGLGWRDAVFTRMTPVTRQGSATVWTAPADVAKHMIACAIRSPSTKMIQAPVVTAWSGMPAHITTRDSRQLVTRVAFGGDGRPAKPETVRTGSTATMAGRKLDQGILVQMVLQDTEILAVHRVGVGRSQVASPDPSAKKAAYQAHACESAVGCCEAAKVLRKVEAPLPPTASPADLLPQAKYMFDDVPYLVEVPEIGSQEIAGEWLIPNDGILLVSFGPHTVADKDGKATIRERLAILEATEAEAAPVAPAPQPAIWGPLPPGPGLIGPPIHIQTVTGVTPLPVVPPPPAPMAVPPPNAAAAPVAPMPPIPGRSIPQGYHSDGRAADLPPLPPEEADDDDADDSAETRPSPQMKKPRPQGETRTEKPQPSADAAMKKAQFSISTNFPAIPTLFQPAPAVGLQFLLPIKPVSFKLPFNRRLEVEIYGRVVRAPEPAQSSADLATKGGATTK